MLVSKRIGLLTIVSLILIMAATGLRSHNRTHDDNGRHKSSAPYLEFTSEVEIECDIDGKQFTHTRVTKDGKIIVDFWHHRPRDPKFTITAEAHGYGWAHVTLYGTIDGKAFDVDGSTNDGVHNYKTEKLGSWVSMLPYDFSSPDHEIRVYTYGKFNKNPKVYKWEAKGTVKLVPVYWKWSSALLVAPTGSWVRADEEFCKTSNAGPKGNGVNGSWTVDRNWSTEGSGSKRIPSKPDDDDEGSEEQGNATPTVPDRPGSFELSPRKTAILLRWTDSESDGGSPITDYEYQIQYSRTQNRTRWTSWSDWTSAGTGNSTWITGLSKNVNYAVRMRAVNAVGSSSVTGIQIVKTSK